jgi:putative membrane protein insertion efficiency factor
MHSMKLAVCSLLASCAVIIAAGPALCREFRTGEGDSLSSAFPASHAIRFYQNYISDLRYGHCHFEPSCSRYAIEAIDECGFLKGSALAADRLVRCYSGADRAYAKSSQGKLLDSPNGSELPCRPPCVPEWLLPPLDDTLPRLEGVSPDSARDVSFADALAARGDCRRAETEYQRIAFHAGTKPLQFWAAMMAGRCYFRSSEWNEAAIRFQKAAGESSAREERSLASFMVASARFNTGDYAASERTLRSFEPDTVAVYRIGILGALCSMARGAWSESADRFSLLAEESPDSLSRRKMLLFSQDACGGLEVPRKNPSVAATFSALLPGAGQCYAGRPSDGLRHFIFDGLLIFSVVQLFRHEQYAPAILLGGFTLPFYVGNIVGAKRSAERFNTCKRLEYVAGSLTRSAAATATK